MTLPSTRSLEMFNAVSETGSFRGAAEQLGLSPSTVSKAIAELEARLGTRLIARTTRHLALTEAGLAYQASVATALDALGEGAEMVHAVTASPRGLVRVAMPVSFGHMFVSPMLPRFVARYPEVRVDAVLSDNYSDPVGDGFDIVIRAAASLPDSSLVARKIMETPHVVCASPDYIERRGTPAHPKQLVDHACLPLTAAIMATDWVFDIDGIDQTVRVDGPISSSNLSVAREAALAGAGIARVPYHVVAADIAAGRLIRLLPDFERVEGAVFVLYPAQRTLALKTRAFIDFLVEEIGSIRA